MASQEVFWSKEQLTQQAETLSQKTLKISAYEAWKQIQEGKHQGSALASKLSQILFLLEEDQFPPLNTNEP